MAIRKEQVLVLLTVAAGLLYWRGIESGAGTRPQFKPAPLPYQPKATATVALVGDQAAVAMRPLFTEPAETRPLPPRILPFPDRAPLTLVALPLEPGPDLGHAELLALPGQPVAEVVLQPTGDATPAVGPTDPTPEQPETREEKIKRWQRVYDSVYRQSLATPLLGTVEIVSGPAGRGDAQSGGPGSAHESYRRWTSGPARQPDRQIAAVGASGRQRLCRCQDPGRTVPAGRRLRRRGPAVEAARAAADGRCRR